MEMYNAIIDIDVERLNLPRRPIFVRQSHAHALKLRGVPADVTNVYVRLFRANGAYFDVAAHEHPDGTYSVRIPSGTLPDVGEFPYEVHARDRMNDSVALGEGTLHVQSFTTTTNPDKPVEPQVVTEMPCEGGGVVQVVQVWDGYDWVQKAIVKETT